MTEAENIKVRAWLENVQHYITELEGHPAHSSGKSSPRELLKQGYVHPDIKERFDSRLKVLIDGGTVSSAPLSFIEITSYSAWFHLHPEKIAGREKATTSIFFPVKIEGTKEDVINTVQKKKSGDLELRLKLKSQALKTKLMLGHTELFGCCDKDFLTGIGALSEETAAAISSNGSAAARVIELSNNAMSGLGAVKKAGNPVFSFQDIIDNYNKGISEDEIIAWVWYKRRIGEKMRGWDKYFIDEAECVTVIQNWKQALQNFPEYIADNRDSWEDFPPSKIKEYKERAMELIKEIEQWQEQAAQDDKFIIGLYNRVKESIFATKGVLDVERYYFEGFKQYFLTVSKAEKTIMQVRGYTIDTDFETVKAELEREKLKVQEQLDALKAPEYKERIIGDITRKKLESKVEGRSPIGAAEDFIKLNYLLKYKFNETDIEGCKIPKPNGEEAKADGNKAALALRLKLKAKAVKVKLLLQEQVSGTGTEPKVIKNFRKELEEKTDEKLAEYYADEKGFELTDELKTEVEDDRDTIINDLVFDYTRVLKSKGEI